MGGNFSVAAALIDQKELIAVTQAGKLELRQWSSNGPELIEAVPSEQRETNLPLQLGVNEDLKTLGLLWSPVEDCFQFNLEFDIAQPMTMRRILSNIARIFDPLGFLAPLTVTLKLFMRDVWNEKLNWDDNISPLLLAKWITICAYTIQANQLKIPRHSDYFPTGEYELHGFSNASEKALAACCYLRGINNNIYTSHLITGKTKVAHMKPTTLPRLELQAALLLSRLMTAVSDALSAKIRKKYYWSDSTITLHWISQSPHKWKTFISNRVAEIQESTDPHRWFHVTSEDNPADCASIGLRASELMDHMWWRGPPWLSTPHFPTGPIPCGSPKPSPELEEKRVKVSLPIATQQTDTLTSLSKFSNWWTTKKVAAYVLRFIQNCQVSKEQRNVGLLNVNEIKIAEVTILKLVQMDAFHDDLCALRNKSPLPKKSKLLQLNPFLDQNQIILVGGRIRHSNLNENRKHPIALPRKGHMINIIIKFYHEIFLHGGTQLIWAHLIGKFHLVHARHTISQVIRKSLVCLKFQAENATQLMADLPRPRVTPSRAFTISGVDMAGPYTLRDTVGRNRTTYKYIVLFICFSTRAIHMEATSSLSKPSFLAALNRFMARRGQPKEIYSDNGTNFEGAANELKEQQQLAADVHRDANIAKELLKQGILWHFQQPSAPHMDGNWEVGVKLVKRHIRKILQNGPLNFEEFTTVINQVESMVNSRPITGLSTSPDDLEPLTPGHFLIGSSLTEPPTADLRDLQMNRLSRFQLLQRMQQEFWTRWSKEYLTRLQNRPKWMTPQPEINEGDLVILKEDNVPPMRWKLARIMKTYQGSDGHVRVVRLRTKGGYDKNNKIMYTEYKRPIVKLIPLPINTPALDLIQNDPQTAHWPGE